MTQDVLRTRPAAEWLERLTAAGVPCAPVLTRGRMIERAAGRGERNVSETSIPAPACCARRATARSSATPRAYAAARRRLQHTDEILAEIGREEGIDA